MTPAKRIKELQTRQLYVGSSMAVKLYAVNGYFHYQVLLTVDTDEKKSLAWIDIWEMNLKRNNIGGQKIPVIETDYNDDFVKASTSKKYVILDAKYNGEDPNELLGDAERIVGKWKCGKQIQRPREIIA